MLKIKIAIPCKGEMDDILLAGDKRTEDDVARLEREGLAKVDILYNPENKLTLTQFGNKHIEESKDCYDYLILMHADVSLSLYDFVTRLTELNGKYDVIGLAGTKKLFISQSPLTWFTGSNKYRTERYGRITHDHDGVMIESYFNKDRPNVLDTEVLTIDGLLMCLSGKAMQTEAARFDEQFTYDFYDLDFCMNVQTRTSLKIGVLVMETIHKSVGKSVLTEDYLVPERKFRMKWNWMISGNKPTAQ